MSLSLSPSTYLTLDRLTKVLGVGLLAAALAGVAGSMAGTVALGAAGLAVGLLTVFVEAPAELDNSSSESGTATGPPAARSDADCFFDRFVHPRIAVAVTLGLVLWVGDFLIAAIGLALRGPEPRLAVTLFRVSGIVGVVGILLVAVPAAYVGVLYVRQFVHGTDEGAAH